MNQLRIAIESRLEEIFLMSLVVHAVCKHLGLNESETWELDLCAVEAASNVIRHAYGQEPGHEIRVEFSFNEERLDLDIWDRGKPMPPQAQEQLRNGSGVFDYDPQNLDDIPEGGMGLQIIHQTIDAAEYTSNGCGNRLRLTRFLRKKPNE